MLHFVFRAQQLQLVTINSQYLRSITHSASVLAEKKNSTPIVQSRSSSSSPPPDHLHQIVPFPSSPPPHHHHHYIPRLTNVITSAIHRLILLVANLRRVGANEMYVRRVLQQQVGVDPIDLDVLSLHHPELFRLSVRHSIEPVVGYLRSQGLAGSALAYLIARAPEVLSLSVEDDIMPLCDFLKANLGSRGIGVLLRHPQIVTTSSTVLQTALTTLEEGGRSIGGRVDEVERAAAAEEEATTTTSSAAALFLLKYPELFIRTAAALDSIRRKKKKRGAFSVYTTAAAAAVGEPRRVVVVPREEDVVTVDVDLQREMEFHVEQIRVAIRSIVCSSSSSSSSHGSGTTIGRTYSFLEIQLQRSVASLEELCSGSTINKRDSATT